jgi:hypothetical protein
MLYSGDINPRRASLQPTSSPPRWARLLDALCLLILALSVVVAMSGGFRIRAAGLRIALTSPYRLAIWAVAIAAIRHLAAPRAPIYRDLPPRIALWWRDAAVRAAGGAFAGTRPAVLFAGYLAVVMIGYQPGAPPWRLTENEFGNLQGRFDTGWYAGIAIDGYSYVPNRPQDQQNIVFFPALPLLMRIAGRMLGGTPAAYVWGGGLLLFAAFFGALVYLFRLARELLGDEEVARTAIWLLAAYPFALFYSAVYTESLFLLGAAAAFYHFRRREYRQSAMWGLLVGLTRPNGCFLALPLGILALDAFLPRALVGGPASERLDATEAPRGLRSSLPALGAAAMPGLGVLLYSAYVWNLTGDPFAWAEGHLAWGRQYQGLGILVSERYEFLSESGVYEYTSQKPGDLLNALGAIFVLVAAWPVARRLGLAYAVFVLVNILPPLAAGGLLSAGRFSSVLFPAFVWLAAVVPPRHRTAWIASFMALQAFDAALFYTWRPLY